jgi:AcrR family transcriptional regulator
MPKADKATRPYSSELRRQQAADTRARVVGAARRLFAQHGYRATTYAQLAAEAGVSVKTVQEHGPKAALLQAAVELASFGVEGEEDFFATDVGRALLRAGNPDELARTIGSIMLTINAPSSRLWTTFVSAADGDPELARFHAELLISIRDQLEHVLHHVETQQWLRTDVPFDDLVESTAIITCFETYTRYVEHDGKTPSQYQEFVTRSIRELVLRR